MIIVVDFYGTLALGNKSHITLAEPNYPFIKRLQQLKAEYDCVIKIVTAKGARNNLPLEEKKKKYDGHLKKFLEMYEGPYDEISYQKEYAHIYIDDMTISPTENFTPLLSPFTHNRIIFTDKSVIKHSPSALFEFEWYKKSVWSVPSVLFCNDELIITERIDNTKLPTLNDYIDILKTFKDNTINNWDFSTYTYNIKIDPYATEKTRKIIETLPEHESTFFHGDLSTSNILKNDITYLIDPNYKNLFGSYLTDAGKLYFSLIAYDNNYEMASKIEKEFGKDVIRFAVAEGLRVCKYKPRYISIVNNIADLYV